MSILKRLKVTKDHPSKIEAEKCIQVRGNERSLLHSLLMLMDSSGIEKRKITVKDLEDMQKKVISRYDSVSLFSVYFEPRETEINSISISAKRWFQKLHGNTYHVVRYSIDHGDWVELPFQYGYGNAYLTTVFEHLKKEKIIETNKEDYTIRTWCKRNHVTLFENNPEDVPRKKDMRW